MILFPDMKDFSSRCIPILTYIDLVFYSIAFTTPIACVTNLPSLVEHTELLCHYSNVALSRPVQHPRMVMSNLNLHKAPFDNYGHAAASITVVHRF